ncbi:MAG: hypothetical protein KDA21_09070, partial [Phycisphaerales bacterium]|nr:hypothetical protein [Phycisphaerales bacterium]
RGGTTGPIWQVVQVIDQGPLRVVVRTDINGVVYPGDEFTAAFRGRVLLHQQIPHPTLHLDADGRMMDVTGNGMLNLVIESDTGGSGCCGTQYIYEYDPAVPSLVPIAVLQGRGRWRDVDGDALPEFVVGDDSFSYRWTSGAESPYPLVILRWRDDHYEAAIDLMRAPAPTRGQIEEWLVAAPTDGIGLTIQRALAMVYTGHADLGWDFLGRANASIWNQPELVNSVRAALEDSPWAADVLRLNRPDAE